MQKGDLAGLCVCSRFFPKIKIDAAEGGGIDFVGIGGRATPKLMANGALCPI